MFDNLFFRNFFRKIIIRSWLTNINIISVVRLMIIFLRSRSRGAILFYIEVSFIDGPQDHFCIKGG